MQLERLGELTLNRQYGIEGRHGLLENHGDFGAPDVSHVFHVDFKDVLSV